MAKKKKHEIMLDNSVGASSSLIDLGEIIPSGAVARLSNFGGYDPIGSDGVGSIISLQWGSGNSWLTIRVGGLGSFDFNWEKGVDFIGDGTKRFRIVRQNRSSVAKVISVWMTVKLV